MGRKMMMMVMIHTCCFGGGPPDSPRSRCAQLYRPMPTWDTAKLVWGICMSVRAHTHLHSRVRVHACVYQVRASHAHPPGLHDEAERADDPEEVAVAEVAAAVEEDA